MLCERCHKNEAAVHTVQVVNGEKSEHYYCESCAREMGLEKPISFEDIFQGLLNFGSTKQEEFANPYKRAAAKCPVCGSFLEEKGKKNPKIVCSNEKCGYMREPEPEKEETTVWVCDICGYRHEGTAAPKACPVCGYSGAHFAVEAKNY